MSFIISAIAVVEIIGYVTSILIILAPIHKFWNIFKKKHVEEKKDVEENISGLPYLAIFFNISGLPYLEIFFNCIMWEIYRLADVQPKCDCTWLLRINIVGFYFQLIYLALDLVFSRSNRVITLVLFMVVSLFGCAFYVWILNGVHDPKIRSKIVGVMCVISGVIMYASTIPSVVKALKNKNIDNVSLLLTLAGSANTAVWLSYAILKHDKFILIQNICGLLLCVVQLIIYGVISMCMSPPTTSEA